MAIWLAIYEFAFIRAFILFLFSSEFFKSTLSYNTIILSSFTRNLSNF